VGGVCSTYGRVENAYKILVEDSKERDRLKDLGLNGKNIKMDLKER
jgi:hypothetical protein